MNYWLMKTEPGEYSIDDLKRDTVTIWTGIRNYQVRNMLRDTFSVGDRAIIYHSSTKIPGAVGEAVVTKEAFPDPLQFEPNSEYFDEKSDSKNPRWLSVELSFEKKFLNVVALEEIKSMTCFSDSPLTRKGNRLSIVPLTKEQFTSIAKAAVR